jgi:capsular exopolysaccharide synthesis family protein
MAGYETSSGIREYLGVLRRRKVWVIGLTLLAAGSALVYSAQQTRLYTSSAEVLVRPVNLDPTQPSTAGGFIDMPTEVRLAASTLVGKLAQKDLAGLRSAPAGLSVTKSEAATLTFTASSPVPRVAQLTAQAYAEAYLEFRKSGVLEDLQAASEPINARIAELTKQINDTQNALFQTPQANESARTSLQIRLNSLLTERGFLEQKRNDLVLPTNVRVGEMLREAQFPTSPSQPDHKRNVAFALFVGLSLGICAAFLRDRMDQRFRSREDFEALVGIPVLAAIPPLSHAERTPQNGVLTNNSPTSPAAEAYKMLRTSVLFTAAQRGARSVLITSCLGDEGKTVSTANLGVAIAQLDKNVVLVSADLRHPSLHRYFSLPNGVGLTSVLSHRDELSAALINTSLPSLLVLPAGPLPGNPTELLGSPAMRDLLRQLKSFAEMVLIDTAPVLGISDALSLASMTDATLLVVDVSRTPPAAVLETKHELERVGSKVVGVVMTNYRGSDPHPFYPQIGSGNGRSRRKKRDAMIDLTGNSPSRSSKTHDVPRPGSR